MKKTLTQSLIALTALAGCASSTATTSLETQQDVDLKKYAGTWHEQARLPNRFQTQCVGDVRADYVLNEDETITVTNTCRLQDGSYETAVGKGRLSEQVEPTDPAKLEVRFAPSWMSWVPAVWGDYWIMKIEGDYEYSLVGTPDRNYLWVLSRDKEADQNIVKELINYAGTLGFAVDEVKNSEVVESVEIK